MDEFVLGIDIIEDYSYIVEIGGSRQRIYPIISTKLKKEQYQRGSYKHSNFT